MHWFTHLKVGTKLIGAFVLGSCVAGIIGAVGIQAAGQIRDRASLMYERETVGLRHAAEARVQLVAAGRAGRGALLAQEGNDRDREINTMKTHFANLREALLRTESTLVTEAEKAIVTNTAAAAAAYEKKFAEVITHPGVGEFGEVRDALSVLMSEALPIALKAEESVNALLAQKQANADGLNKETDAFYAMGRSVMLGLTLFGILAGIATGGFIARGLTAQLGGQPADVARVANAISAGDLTTPIDTSHARAGSIVLAISLMQESLRRVVGSVRDSSESIASGSVQIAAGNTDLSQRTERQSENLGQTAAAMEQLSSTVKSNADVAQQAAALAASASAAASNGGDVVNSVVTTMAEINTSSRKIVEIISVIDSIAFQTNILALNAAVEAARAGEEGRGFAVVAAEVRNLAQKSAAAAKDIKTLIDDSVQKVDAGSKMADAAGITMQDVVDQVKRVNDLIAEISAATNEQTAGLGQINDAVLQLSDATQQNAALVEQSAVAAVSLNEQTRQLVSAVGAFNLGTDLPTLLLDDPVQVAHPTRMALAA
ncbi:MAG TPA: methyl-accepting chemotaxis protein [Candidimonas sp.]|nr:methyl-accepting chemotaxis protein [Candidimonas sp.]